MKQSLHSSFVFMALIAMLLAACATTQLNAVWKDPSYQAHPHKIMVIGVAKSPVNRRIFEDEFVRQLHAHGTEAIASYTVLPDKKEGDQEIVAEKLAQLGADTVLITRTVSRKTVKFWVPGTPYYPPPYYATWPDYYGYGYQAMYTPGYMAEEEFAVVESNMYEAASNKLIWATSSETGTGSADQSRIKSYIDIMVKTMAEQQLLGR